MKKNEPAEQGMKAPANSTGFARTPEERLSDALPKDVNSPQTQIPRASQSTAPIPSYLSLTSSPSGNSGEKAETTQYVSESIVEALGEGICVLGTDFRIVYQNQTHKDGLGDHLGEFCYEAFQLGDHVCEDCPVAMCFVDGKTHTLARTVPGNRPTTFAEVKASPLRDSSGKIIAGIEIVRDVTERKMAEKALAERANLAALTADMGVALTKGDTLRRTLISCAEALLAHLDAATARIWTFDDKTNLLEIQASVGLATAFDDQYARIPLGKFKMGLIARERRPYLTNKVIGNPRIHPQEWAVKEGIVSFAGHPLIVDERLAGVMAIFARKPLSKVTLDTLASVAQGIALGIERKRAEEELKETSQALEALVEASPLSIFAANLNGQITKWNKAAERILGWSADEAIGRALPLVPKEKREEFGAIQTQIRQGETVAALETVRLRKDGTPIDISVSTAVMRDSAGNISGTMAIMDDISERKRVEEALKFSEERFRLLAENAQDVIVRYRLAPEHGFEYISPSITFITGYSPEEFYANRDLILEIVHPEDKQLLENLFSNPISSSEPFTIRWQSKNGPQIWTEQRIVVATDQEGKPVAIEAIARDITRRKQAEEALLESEEKYRTLFELASDAFLTVIFPVGIIDANEAAGRMLGYSKEELKKLSGRDIIAPEIYEEAMHQWVGQTQARGYFLLETKWVRKDGSRINVEVGGRPFQLGGQSVFQLIGRDITERKRAEETLLQSEEKYRLLVENIPDVVWIADRTGNTVFISQNIERILGFTPDEMYEGGDQAWFGKIHPSDVEKVEEAFELLFTRNIKLDVEYRLQRKDGEWIWIRDRAITTYDEGGNLYARGVFTDITERRQAEEALKESEEQYRLIVETAQEGIWVFDEDCRATFANEKMAEMLGYAADELIGKCFVDFLDEEEKASALAMMERHRQGVPGQQDFRFRRKDGSGLWAIVSANPIFDRKRRFVGALAMITDITERKQAEQLQDEYISLISHDLRNPLAIILGQAQLLQRALDASGFAGHDLYSAHSIVESARQMNAMIQDLIDSAHLETGKLQVHPTPLLLHIFVSDLLERMVGTIETDRIMSEIPEGLPPIQADSNYMARILTNLLTNALKYSPPQSEVLVRAKGSNDGVIISVADKGIGIASEELPHVFDRFYRSQRIRKAEGFGLGLYITKMLVESHSGRIWVESEPGVGSTFYFSLPIA